MTDFVTDLVAPAVTPDEAAPILQHGADVEILRRNGDVDWSSFNPEAYWSGNYRTLRPDDQTIAEMVGEFFSRHFREAPRLHFLRALDVGSGGNLYPALAMLPWSRMITLSDVSPAGLEWLRAAATGVDADDERGRWVWQPFWAEYARYPGYQQVPDPRAELAGRHEIRSQDVLRLEPAGWDLGTMFFVAESVTSCPAEFAAAVHAFGRALVPGAPFAAALMEGSVGYRVDGLAFPAVRAVDLPLAHQVFSAVSGDVRVRRVDVPVHDPVQDGYQGMIVATGTAAG